MYRKVRLQPCILSQNTPLICMTILLIPDYPVRNLFFYVYYKPVNIAIFIVLHFTKFLLIVIRWNQSHFLLIRTSPLTSLANQQTPELLLTGRSEQSFVLLSTSLGSGFSVCNFFMSIFFCQSFVYNFYDSFGDRISSSTQLYLN